MPLTASKTEADTIAAMRLVKNGLVPAASTVLFIMLIHSNTGSGVAAGADGREAPNRNTRPNTVTTKRVTALILLMAIPPLLSVTSSAPLPGKKQHRLPRRLFRTLAAARQQWLDLLSR